MFRNSRVQISEKKYKTTILENKCIYILYTRHRDTHKQKQQKHRHTPRHNTNTHTQQATQAHPHTHKTKRETAQNNKTKHRHRHTFKRHNLSQTLRHQQKQKQNAKP